MNFSFSINKIRLSEKKGTKRNWLNGNFRWSKGTIFFYQRFIQCYPFWDYNDNDDEEERIGKKRLMQRRKIEGFHAVYGNYKFLSDCCICENRMTFTPFVSCFIEWTGKKRAMEKVAANSIYQSDLNEI